MRHLVHMASLSAQTNMHARNLAIVWAPNLLRCVLLGAAWGPSSAGGGGGVAGVGLVPEPVEHRKTQRCPEWGAAQPVDAPLSSRSPVPRG